METCRFAAIRFREGHLPQVDELSCEGCRACSVVCPAEAIEFLQNRAGTIFQRETRCGPLVHAMLGVAQGNSGKLVARVREQTRNIAEERGLELALIDGPPGIGCPVHASLGGADLVVAVTEPTPSGLHDLLRMIDLLHHFKLHSVLLVNKWDLNPQLTESIERTARARGATPIGRVPFDARVPIALAHGKTPLVVPPVRRALKKAWHAICCTRAEATRGGSDAA
jgi:MinD superfamily P-loop ATPase